MKDRHRARGNSTNACAAEALSASAGTGHVDAIESTDLDCRVHILLKEKATIRSGASKLQPGSALLQQLFVHRRVRPCAFERCQVIAP